MPTSRPLVQDDLVVAIDAAPGLFLGALYTFDAQFHSAGWFVLANDFNLPSRSSDMWWDLVGMRVFGINWALSYDPRLLSAIRRGTAPALYVREGDTVEPWSSYQAVLLGRRRQALIERHAAFMNRLRQHGAGTTHLHVEDDVVVIQCGGALPNPDILAQNIPEGVRVEALPATQRPLPNFPSNRYRATDQQRQMAERLAAAMNIPLDISAAELGGTLADTPPPPPLTRFNLLECDLPAVDPTPAKQKHFDALAELQATFRAAKVATKTAVQPVLTRFDLLECDEPAEPVTVRSKWSAPTQRLQPQPQQPHPERRTVEDILDLTTSGPLEALAALQITKAEIVRDLWQRGTN